MTRTEFIHSCTACTCSCAAVALLPRQATAQDAGGSEAEALRGRLNAAQLRFAKLVEVLNETLDPEDREKVFTNLGRQCALEYSNLTGKYRNNITGFLEMAQSQWVEKAEYDEQAGVIRITDKSRDCTCPLVKKGLTPGEFCDCTLGWQKEAYSTMLGKPVEVELEKSILRGDDRCIFRIRIL